MGREECGGLCRSPQAEASFGEMRCRALALGAVWLGLAERTSTQRTPSQTKALNLDENGKDLTGQKDNAWQHPQGVLPKIEEIVAGKK